MHELPEEFLARTSCLNLFPTLLRRCKKMGKKNKVREKAKSNLDREKNQNLNNLLTKDFGNHILSDDFGLDNMEDSNAIIIHSGKKRSRENTNANLESEKKNKNLQRKLRRIEEERVAREKREKAFQILTEHKLCDNELELMHSSGSIGKFETMKEKLRRELKLERAGILLPKDSSIIRKRKNKEHKEEEEEDENDDDDIEFKIKNEYKNMTDDVVFSESVNDKNIKNEIDHVGDDSDGGNNENDKTVPELNIIRNNQINGNNNADVVVDDDGDDTSIVNHSYPQFQKKNGVTVDEKKKQKKKRKRKKKEMGKKENEEKEEKNNTNRIDDKEDERNNEKSNNEKNITVKSNNDVDVNKSDKVDVKKATYITVVRTKEIKKVRENLPIIMYEQEIMDLIQHNSFLIVCGETGSGKTTQIPQFLYEAGYGSECNFEHSGMIGVTQPRRVAVISTAQRVAFELNSSVGSTVGFQIRHDVHVGKKAAIKFMTDGILLREIQSDFLLSKYSAIILDEAHERSVNTDILIGMCSRIVPLRQKLYEESRKKNSSSQIKPLKVIIMSATLRVEDFIKNKKLFPIPPPLMHIPSRQFPVTVHFSRKTELNDYLTAVFKKVSAIHRKLPPGSILLFLTGRREVEYMCQKLRRSFSQSKRKWKRGKENAELSSNQEQRKLSNKDADVGDEKDEDEDEGDNIMKDGGRMEGDDDLSLEMNLIDENWDAGGADVSTFDMGKDEDDYLDEEREEDFQGKDDYEEGSGGEGEEEESDIGEEDIWAEEEEEGEEDGRDDKLSKKDGKDGDESFELWKSLPSLKSLSEKIMEENKKEEAHEEGGKGCKKEDGKEEEELKKEKEEKEEKEKKEKEKEKERKKKLEDCSKMYVLPLYAMLPAKEQLRVFAKIPDGFRLVVVATNVAETSLTIPGIRYVVDCGRSKQRTYDRSNGVSRFEVNWISKASAEQRCGRAGRTGPGHCYRVYSSAHFNNSFPLFSSPEMMNVPIEGVVLQMKAMGIDKVLNFPFPSPPDSSSMKEAEKCLLALSALSPSTNQITDLGKFMSSMPINPRHAKTLLSLFASATSSTSLKKTINPFLLSLCIAVISALSLENPFLLDFGFGGEEEGKEKDKEREGGKNEWESKKKEILQDDVIKGKGWEGEKDEKDRKEKGNDEEKDVEGDEKRIGKERKKTRMKQVKILRSKFMNSQSDAISIANALCAYEQTDNKDKFCSDYYIHARTIKEMSLLRKQLLKTVMRFGNEKLSYLGWKDKETFQKLLNEGEERWSEFGEDRFTMAIEEEKMMMQALCAGWVDRVAKKILPSEKEMSEENAKLMKNRRFVPYLTCSSNEFVFLSPDSSVRKISPKFVVFNELVQVTRTCMRHVTAIEPTWLPYHSPNLCSFSKPLSEPNPWYEEASDEIMCFVSPSFGMHGWELPLHAVPMKHSKNRTCVFALHLLKGSVFKSLKNLKEIFSVNPNVLLQPTAMAHRCVVEILAALGEDSGALDSRTNLVNKWIHEPEFLLREILLWVQNAQKNKVGQIWKDLLKEVSEFTS